MKRIYSKISLLLCVAIVATGGAFAQQPTASATLDRNALVIGDQAKLTLRIDHLAKNTTIQWPALSDSMKGWEVVDTGQIDTLQQSGYISLHRQLIITSFDSGKYSIPSFLFKYAENGAEKTIGTEPLTIFVNTVQVDTAQPIKPIKDIVEIEQELSFLQKLALFIGSHLPLILTIAGSVFLIIIGIVLYLVFKKKKTAVPKITETPFARSMRMLQELEEQRLQEKGLLKEHYSMLSDIVRNYLDDQFRMNAMEQTTDELLAALKKKNDFRKIRTELKILLRTADLVKFAKAQPGDRDYRLTLDAAYAILKKTKPAETIQ